MFIIFIKLLIFDLSI